MISLTKDQSENKEKHAWGRICYLLLSIAVSSVVAYFAPEYAARIKDLVALVTTIMPILTGFTMAVIGIVGGLDSVLSSFTWQSLQKYEETFNAKIRRQSYLCIMQLISLCAALIVTAIGDKDVAYMHFCRLFVFSSSLALLTSFTFPLSLHAIHKERYELLMLERGAPHI